MLTEKIEILPNPNGSFFVQCGEKYNDSLTFDEMLGTVAQLCVTEKKRCLEWLWTAEQWAAYNKRMEDLRQNRMEAKNDQASNSHD
jgi:hypothetical protein